MGWGYGVLPDGRQVGYSVLSICEAPECETQIDRGLASLCGRMHGQDDGEGCGHYFCASHLYYGGPNQMCGPCLDAWDAEQEREAFKEKLKSINFGRVPGGAR